MRCTTSSPPLHSKPAPLCGVWAVFPHRHGGNVGLLARHLRFYCSCKALHLVSTTRQDCYSSYGHRVGTHHSFVRVCLSACVFPSPWISFFHFTKPTLLFHVISYANMIFHFTRPNLSPLSKSHFNFTLNPLLHYSLIQEQFSTIRFMSRAASGPYHTQKMP